VRRPHRIGEVPAWQRWLILIVASLFGATLLLFAAWAVILFTDWMRVDECLDSGGSYDYERGVCDFERQHDAP
jgi:hypothetical protein